ncbi:type II toxin-antitoxin system RelE family toxin [Desulfobacca acetoxidans]|uniref:Plasmid stabilization system n=1 Tax=Desulfobacca acetoxidans (strain ATCC 700848 / DSM 11109 / ASRB2) TaxID=880072 RepID=F2NJK3_DESAR|nr:type II toxin-antitoxin system RelE/ParE family toxin [Desulfobacca acetoxidans]AEB09515.1 plasmid stabilization system [Desulfobacca acetoxidans DSM 11109]
MSYTAHIARKAAKEIKGLDKATAKRIRERIRELAVDPYDRRISGPIKMGEGMRKSRVGDWRLIFKIDDTHQLIIILAVKPRRRAYPNQ